MTGSIEKNKSQLTPLFVLLELVVLLALPMPFLDLNILYVVIAIAMIVFSKLLRKEQWSRYGFRKVQFNMVLFGYLWFYRLQCFCLY